MPNQEIHSNTEKEIWLEINIIAPEETREIIINLATELGSTGFWETENSIKSYFKKSEWNKEKEKQLLSLLQNLKQENPKTVIEISIKEFTEENWNKIWEKSIEPIEVGEKFVIKPTWKEYKSIDKIIIQIDPKMAFGTGHHETTRLMLKAIEKYLYPGCKILDVGTGSGILAIAGIKLGAEKAIGVDNDEWAYQNAIENVQINKVEDKFEIILGSIESIKETNFDLILANINKNAIVSMMAQFYDKLKTNGILITSGYLDIEQGTIEEHLKMYDFEIIDVLKENEWIAIVAKK